MPDARFDGTLAGWRTAARGLLAAGVAPDAVVWRSDAEAQGALALGGAEPASLPPGHAAPPGARVPRRFLGLAALVACHRDPERWGALYRVLWRLTRGGEPRLLAVSVDADVLRLTRMAKAVRRDVHKMHAFVRFRAVPDDAGDAEYVAWFEPEHDVVARAAPLFVRRFPNMRWAILTPRGTARWDGASLALGPGVPAREAPGDDSLEALWGVYYAHVFNPARVKLAAMRAEMPKRYWRNLPEARLIEAMVRDAPARVRRMVAAQTAGSRASHDDPVEAPAAVRASTARAMAERATVGVPPLEIAGAEVRVGTVGWTDGRDGTSDGWYPAAAATPDARLRHYAARLPLVEVDLAAAFPTRTLAALWAERTPAGFTFDVRVPALLTGHPVEPRRLPRRLRDLLPRSLAGANRIPADVVPPSVRDAAWATLLDALAPLADAGRLGALLLRFPPTFAPSRAAADALTAAREGAGASLAAVELPHADWMGPRVRGRTLALLERLGFAHVVTVLAADVPVPTHPGLTVLRLGAAADTPNAPIAARIAEAAEGVQAVHVIAGNARAAERVMAMTGGPAVGTSDGGAATERITAAVHGPAVGTSPRSPTADSSRRPSPP